MKNMKTPQKSKQSQKGSNGKPAIKAINAPVARTTLVKTGKPVFSMPPVGGDGRVLVRHREYIQDIIGTANFTVLALSINPGLLATFPWLSQIAPAYESYRFKRLSFIYEPACATSTAGSVMLAVDFDASDPAPSSKAVMLSYQNAVRAAPWASVTYHCSAQDLAKLNQRYVRRGQPPPTSNDLLLYDVGSMFVATFGNTVVSIGELHVDYELELYTPQLTSLVSAGDGIVQIAANTPSITAPFGLSDYFGPQGLISVTNVAGLSTLTINQPGRYLMSMTSSATTEATTGVLITPVTVGSTAAAPTGVSFTASTTAYQQLYILNAPVGGTVFTIAVTGAVTTQLLISIRLATYPAL
jgi:hypothetical protein